jgi:hypothetical protein
VLKFKFGGNALSQTYSNSFSISRVRSFHDIHTLGTMCNLSFGGMGDTFTHTWSHFLFLKKKKKKILHVHVCLKIFG